MYSANYIYLLFNELFFMCRKQSQAKFGAMLHEQSKK